MLRPVCAPPLCKNTNLFGTLSFVRCFFLTFVPLNPCLDTETLKTVTHESQTKWPFLSVGSEFSPCLAFLFFLRRRLVGAKPLFYSLHRRGETECRQGADRKRGSREENPPIFGENVRQIYIFLPVFVGAPRDRGVLLQCMRRLSPLFAETQPLLRRPASRPRRRVPRCAIDLHQSC